MPLYFGYDPKDTKKVSDTLLQQGVPLLRAAPGSFKAKGLPRFPSFIFGIVVHYISYLIFAVVRNLDCALQEWGRLTPVLPSSSRLPFQIPGLALRLKENSESVINELINRGFHPIDLKRTTQYLKGEPTLDDLNYVKRNVQFEQTGFVPYGYADMNAVLAFTRFVTLGTALVHMLSRAVYPTGDDFEHAKIGGKRKRTAQQMDVDEERLHPYLPELKTKSTLWDVMESFFNKTDETSVFGTIQGMMARPLRQPSIYYDSTPNVENLSGVVCPFVPDLALRDKDGPIPVIERYLSGTLGNSPQEIADGLEIMRSSWGILSKTVVGYELAHLYKCIEIAIEAQCGLKVLIDRSCYVGSILVGENFTIACGGKVIRPVSSAVLEKELLETPTHPIALAKIQTILQRYRQEVDIQGLTTMGALREVCINTPVTQADRVEIIRAAHSLRFSKPWAINPDSLIKFISMITRTGEDVSEAPITANALFETDRIAALLTAFGKSVPSPVIPGGRALDLKTGRPAPKTETIAARTKSGQKRTRDQAVDEFEQTVQFRLVKYAVACSDWAQVVREGNIYVLPSLTAKNSMIRIFRGAFAQNLWTALSSLVIAVPSQEEKAREQRVEREAEGKKATEGFLDLGDFE